MRSTGILIRTKAGNLLNALKSIEVGQTSNGYQCDSIHEDSTGIHVAWIGCDGKTVMERYVRREPSDEVLVKEVAQ